MEFNIEKYISNFVESQFPSFYLEEGEMFILFVKAYYSWMEETGQPIHEARRLFDYRDIDNTLEKFLEYFQKKYLYGIPFSIISNKRQLLKHVLDVYRSKTNINCYKLLFRMVYNEDLEVYIPGYDLLKPSDGTWVLPTYIEVTQNNNLRYLVGKRIIGITSKTTCTIEDYVRESYNNDISNLLYISNVEPYGGNFISGEKIIAVEDQSNTQAISSAAYILGSLDSLDIISGGQNFKIGDIIKVVDRSLSNGEWVSYGNRGLFRVAEVANGTGSLTFTILGSGFGYTANSSIFLYNGPADNGSGASFQIGFLSNTQNYIYNTDIIVDQANLALDSLAFRFVGNAAANVYTTLQDSLLFTNNQFGSIMVITNLQGGNNYTKTANVFVRSTMQSSLPLQGSITYSTSSATITGTGTNFLSVFQNNQVVYIQSDPSDEATGEYHVINQVLSDTQLVLNGFPKFNSTATSIYKVSPSILGSQFAFYESPMASSNNTINGLNEFIRATPSFGNSVVTRVEALDSGLGYVDGEFVTAYLYNGISNNVMIIDGGTGYSNTDKILFIGGGSYNPANGFITTDANGTITSVSVPYQGSGYTDYPTIRINTNTGYGAELKVEFSQFNTTSQVTGRVVKKSIGKGRGYWSTTRSFLSSDKVIQDSYYYQDYSYELQVGVSLNKYKQIIYDTFHHAGNELFGKYLSINVEESLFDILYEDGAANTYPGLEVYLVDTTLFSVDSTKMSVDRLYIY